MGLFSEVEKGEFDCVHDLHFFARAARAEMMRGFVVFFFPVEQEFRCGRKVW